jgi:hypothetical protein
MKSAFDLWRMPVEETTISMLLAPMITKSAQGFQPARTIFRRCTIVAGVVLGLATFLPTVLYAEGERPAIALEPTNRTVYAGDSVTFGVKDQRAGESDFQWQRMRGVQGRWTDMVDTDGVSGAKTRFLMLGNVSRELDGDLFRLIIYARDSLPFYTDPARLLVVPVEGKDRSGLVHVLLAESGEAFRNPMKGFRPTRYFRDSGFKAQEYASVYKHYIRYTDLESSPADSVAKIVEWSNQSWAGIENENSKVIPRVVIYYPDNGEFWAAGIPHSAPPYREGNWTNAVLKQRLVAMIAKLGMAWDSDPRVAAVELGLWGKWGEHHIDPSTVSSIRADIADPSRIPPDFQTSMGDAAVRAFKTKKILIRYPGDTFVAYQFGCYWDSFGLPEDAASGNAEISKGNWRTQMNSGEVAFDWGSKAAVGGSPDGALSDIGVSDRIDDWIRRTHTSSLGWISEYNPGDPEIERNAKTMQKSLGYRYVVKEASYSRDIIPGSRLTVEFTVTNVGAAPFYYSWPVQAALIRQDHSVAWRGTFEADVTHWISCQDYQVSEQFVIPGTLSRGTYILALCVCDPAGMLPCLRFANANYYRGGWTPIGKVGVSEEVESTTLMPFDTLAGDHSLRYVVTQQR